MEVLSNHSSTLSVDGFGGYSEGRRVAWKDGNYFHTDHAGRRCYEANYLYVGIYDKGLAPAIQVDGTWCYIDYSGTPVIAGTSDSQFEYAGPFIGNQALVIIRGLPHLINRNQFRIK
jgi:hypothetical protein